MFHALYKNETINSNDVNVQLVKDPEINAFAQEDGTIYINLGMLAASKTEAELASVFGHEWGHVVLNHNFNSFKAGVKYSQRTTLANGVILLGAGIAGRVIHKLSENKLEDDLVSLEIQADSSSISACKHSDYSTMAGVAIEKFMLRKEEKEKQKTGYQQPKQYIQTHPETKKRLDVFEKAMIIDSMYKKNFIVDKDYFFKLKQQIEDESIYLLFKQQNFDDCIEKSFVQYLNNPKDKFYLFFLVESIRRLMAIDKAVGDKNFITGKYVLKPKKDIVKPQVIISTKYKTNTIGDFVYKNTIFYYLKELLFIDEPEILKYKQLVNNDTLEFITYNDAYLFFKNETGCYTCNLGDRLLGIPNTQADSVPQNNLETYYNKLSAQVKTYLKNNNTQSNLVIVEGFNDYAAFNFSGTENNDNEKTFVQNLARLFQDKQAGKYDMEYKLRTNEFNDLQNYYNCVSNNLPKSTTASPYVGKLSKTYECKTIFPEMVEVLNTHNYNKVFYVSAANYNYGTYSNDYCLITMIDFKRNKIAKTGVKLGAFSSSEGYLKTYEIIEALNKN